MTAPATTTTAPGKEQPPADETARQDDAFDRDVLPTPRAPPPPCCAPCSPR